MSMRTTIAVAVGSAVLGAGGFALCEHLLSDDGVSTSLPFIAPVFGDCGRTTFENLRKHTERPEFQCMRDAAKDRKIATLLVDGTTQEGDPFGDVYFLNPNGTVSLVSDSRQDKFGSRRVDFEECVDQLDWLPSAIC